MNYDSLEKSLNKNDCYSPDKIQTSSSDLFLDRRSVTIPPMSKASGEVANFIKRTITHPPVNCVKNMSVCLSRILTPIISGLAV